MSESHRHAERAPWPATPLLVLLAALTLAPAVLIGGVHPTTQLVVLAAALGGCVLLLAHLARRPSHPVKMPRHLVLAMAIGCLATALQLIPLPRSLLHLLSPAAFDVRTLVTESSDNRWWPVSLAPSSTALQLANHLTCVACFFLAAQFLHRKSRARTVLQVFFAGGLVISALALAQRALGLKRILGFYKPDWWEGFVGTFVDNNHAAGFFLLVLGVGVGLAVSAEGRARVALMLSLALPLLGLFLTASRGGLFGLACLLVLVAALGARAGAIKEKVVIGSGLVIVVAIAFAYGGDTLRPRVMQLVNGPVGRYQKVEVWRDSIRVATHYPLVGVGRGAFQDVFPQYKQFHDAVPVTITHVEDLPIQAATDWGIPVALVLIGLVLITFVGLGLQVRGDALLAAVFAGVAALLAQNLMDFNLEFPGTAVPATILLGLLVARVQAKELPTPRGRLDGSLPIAVIAAVGVAALVGALPNAGHVLRAQDREMRTLLGSATQLEPAAKEAESAVIRHPADYRTHLMTGLLYLRFGDSHGLRHMNLAMLLNPLDAAAHLEAARVLAAANHGGQAALEYRTSLEHGLPYDHFVFDEIVKNCGPERALTAISSTPAAAVAFADWMERSQRKNVAVAAYGVILASRAPEASRLAAARALVRLHADPEGKAAAELGRIGRDTSDLLQAADALLKRNDLDGAEKILARAAAPSPDRAARIVALEKLAQVQEQLHHFVDARDSHAMAAQLRAISASR